MDADPHAPAIRPAATADDPRWAQVLRRDRAADGRFWYSVATTGVYCRPSCPSRAARPENVTLHATLAEARASGARPCRRCNPDGSTPDDENAALVERACRTLEAAEETPDLAALADAAGLSPGYFHRLFKATTGLTPRQYAAAQKGARVADGLAGAGSVTEAIFAAGYGSNSRFYAEAKDLIGMTPSRYRAGARDEALHYAVRPCALGHIIVAFSDAGIAAIQLGDDPDELVAQLQARFPGARLVGGDAGCEALVAEVVSLVAEPGRAHALPLDVRGTAFQRRVWQALRAIPAGETATYTEIAARIGAPGAVRAVAGACAANAHAVAIPCHRVIRSDGALSGYRWGVERKRRLLAQEAGNEGELDLR